MMLTSIARQDRIARRKQTYTQTRRMEIIVYMQSKAAFKRELKKFARLNRPMNAHVNL